MVSEPSAEAMTFAADYVFGCVDGGDVAISIFDECYYHDDLQEADDTADKIQERIATALDTCAQQQTAPLLARIAELEGLEAKYNFLQSRNAALCNLVKELEVAEIYDSATGEYRTMLYNEDGYEMLQFLSTGLPEKIEQSKDRPKAAGAR